VCVYVFEGKGHHHTSLLSPLHLFYSFVSTNDNTQTMRARSVKSVCGYSTEEQQRKNRVETLENLRLA
jgi:N-acetylneuraminic acid mutarotase